MQDIHINMNDKAEFNIKITFNENGKKIDEIISDIYNQYILNNCLGPEQQDNNIPFI